MKASEFRKYFPALEREINGKPLIYFDNAATSQRPVQVTDFLNEMNLKHNANIHRAVHTLAVEATDAYEDARNEAQRFLNASSREEIIFTSGATAGMNLVAYSFGAAFIRSGDEIIVGTAEHHSNFVPWQMLALRNGAVVKYLHPSESGTYTVEGLKALLGERTRLVCLGHASNVFGLVNPIRELIAAAHEAGSAVMVDGAQGAVHCKVDVQALDCDFYSFSAHKVLGPTGVGVLYGKKKWLEKIPPFLCGGEMVGTVSLNGTSFAPLPMKFEAGTQNFANAAALKPALQLADKMLADSELNAEMEVTSIWLLKALHSFDGLHIYGDVHEDDKTACGRKLPIFSFSIDGVHHEDLAILLDKMGIAARSGQMCAEPLMTACGVTGMLRVSLLQYNTIQEAETFIAALERAVGMLR